jgi:hypothetical protein
VPGDWRASGRSISSIKRPAGAQQGRACWRPLHGMVARAGAPLHEDAVRWLYHAATVKASGNVDNEGLIGRARKNHRFGLRRANIFRHYQAELELLVAARGLGGTTPSTSPSPFQDRGGREGGVVAATSRGTITQHIEFQ